MIAEEVGGVLLQTKLKIQTGKEKYKSWNSRRIEIFRSESNRIEELIETYSVFKKVELQESVLRIKKRLGPQRTKIALESIEDEKWDLVCKSVLDYYDRCYEYEKVGIEKIKLLDLTDKKFDKKILKLINALL